MILNYSAAMLYGSWLCALKNWFIQAFIHAEWKDEISIDHIWWWHCSPMKNIKELHLSGEKLQFTSDRRVYNIWYEQIYRRTSTVTCGSDEITAWPGKRDQRLVHSQMSKCLHTLHLIGEEFTIYHWRHCGMMHWGKPVRDSSHMLLNGSNRKAMTERHRRWGSTFVPTLVPCHYFSV